MGLDLGTSSLKATLLAEDGRVLADAEARYPTIAELDGQAEQEPSRWIQAAAQALDQIHAVAGSGWADGLEAIGLAGQLPTLVCLGQGRAIGNAITWQDSRADSWLAERLTPSLRRAVYLATGMPIDGRYLGPLFQYHWSSRRESVERILSAKDYLCFALTGRYVTDPSTAAGYAIYGIAENDWLPDLCTLWDISPSLLPEVSEAGGQAGPLSANGARILNLPEGIPVLAGAADSVMGAFAMTGLRPNCASVAMGSSSIIFAATPQRQLDSSERYLLTPHAVTGWYGREMDLLSSGIGFAWLGGLLDLTPEALATKALESRPGAGGVVFGPYLAGGEQGALWDPSLTGVIHGLSTATTANDLARAYLEAVFFEVRRCLDVLGQDARIDSVVLSGRAAANSRLLHLFADVLGRPIKAFTRSSPSSIGAAMLGADTSEGRFQSPTLVGPEILPGNDAAAYDSLYEQYLDLFPALARRPSSMEADT